MGLRATDKDLELIPDEEENDYWCELCDEEFYESHYHCAHCGEVANVMGHYDFDLGRFTCVDIT